MQLAILSSWGVANKTIRYLRDPATDTVALELVPTARLGELDSRRAALADEFCTNPGCESLPSPASVLDPLVQVKRIGGGYPGAFAHAARSAPGSAAFCFAGQRREVDGTLTSVITDLVDRQAGHWIEHRLSWHEGDEAVTIETSFLNDGVEPVTLEFLSSFSMGGMKTFVTEAATRRLRIYRFRSARGAERRHVVETLEQFHFGYSWSGNGRFSIGFEQVGAIPLRQRVPFVALEDAEAGITWAAQIGRADSWQLELACQNDSISLSGGIFDREVGRGTKTLVPGECLEAPPAYLTCVAGDFDAVCGRLPPLIVASPRRSTSDGLVEGLHI